MRFVAAVAGTVRANLSPSSTSRASELAAHLAEYGSPEGWVFPSNEGTQLRHRNFARQHFSPAVEAAGLPEKLRPHDLRHTCAALMISEGAHVKLVQDRLGHSTIRVTLDRYGHLMPNLDEQLMDRLDNRFRELRADQSRTRTDSVVALEATQGA